MVILINWLTNKQQFKHWSVHTLVFHWISASSAVNVSPIMSDRHSPPWLMFPLSVTCCTFLLTTPRSVDGVCLIRMLNKRHSKKPTLEDSGSARWSFTKRQRWRGAMKRSDDEQRWRLCLLHCSRTSSSCWLSGNRSESVSSWSEDGQDEKWFGGNTFRSAVRASERRRRTRTRLRRWQKRLFSNQTSKWCRVNPHTQTHSCTRKTHFFNFNMTFSLIPKDKLTGIKDLLFISFN